MIRKRIRTTKTRRRGRRIRRVKRRVSHCQRMKARQRVRSNNLCYLNLHSKMKRKCQSFMSKL